MGLFLSFNAKVYYLLTGTCASWGSDTDGFAVGAAPDDLDLIADVKDISIPIEKTEANVTTRANAGWEAVKGTIRKMPIDLPMVYDPSDAGFMAVYTAFLTDTTIAIALLDGDKATTGTIGVWADFEVLKAEKGEKLEDAQMMNFSIKPGYSAVAPEVVKVGS